MLLLKWLWREIKKKEKGGNAITAYHGSEQLLRPPLSSGMRSDALHTVVIRIMKNNQLGLINFPSDKHNWTARKSRGKKKGSCGAGDPVHTLVTVVSAAPYADGIISFY